MTTQSMWLNGELVDDATPAIFANDHGFLLGDGVFDTLTIRDGVPVFLGRHLRRLRKGVDRLLIANTPTDEELSTALFQLIESNSIDTARARITITPGPGSSPRDRGAQPLTVISTSPLQQMPSSVSLCTVPWTRNERSPLAGIKSTSWGENASILRFAATNGFDNAILCDSTGRLSECTTSNLYLVIDDHIVTPSIESGCLPGIIREVLIDEQLVSERDLVPSDLELATEVFITSSTTGIMPVHCVDEHTYATPGHRTANAKETIARLSNL
jgi:branched-chain amino acid aminotransferase